MKKLSRRDFVQAAAVSTGAAVLASCKSENEGKNPATRSSRSRTSDKEIRVTIPDVPKEELYETLDRRVNFYMNACHHCAQASYVVLEEQFGLGESAILKALTPLPGIGERGETCGAVIGSLLALGLVIGRDRLDDWNGYRASLIPARRFCERFEDEFGSTMCADILEKQFGRRFDLGNEMDLAEFQASGATEKCSAVVRKAVRITADLILENA